MSDDSYTPRPLSREDAAELASLHGLKQSGVRPPLVRYIGDLWTRRHFLWTLGTADAYGRNQQNYLGQAWTVINPLLSTAVFFVIFGLVLKTNHGIDNFIPFLVIGVFIYNFMSQILTRGSRSVTSRLALVRALDFPRAALPIAVVMAEFVTLLPALAVMLIIVLLGGEPITWMWLGLPVAVGLTTVFSLGCAFILARLVAEIRDLANLVPVALQLLRYLSGIFYAIGHYVSGGYEAILTYQPFALMLDLTRQCLMEEMAFNPAHWLAGLAWALGMVTVGFVFFWRAEVRYGRD